MAGIPPPEERQMPTYGEAKLMKDYPDPEERKKYMDALVLITSQPSTWGKQEIESDMDTALLLNASEKKDVEWIKSDAGKSGLGKPRYDVATGKVYLSTMPIDWLDPALQNALEEYTDEETWAKILANKSVETGGGGGRRGGRRGGGFAYAKTGFTKGVPASYKGPLTAEGKSKADVFFTLPKSQRTKYLDENPDLKAYFGRQKEGESDEDYRERMGLMALADRYYHIPSKEARRGFLRDHPELIAYFEMARQKKDTYWMKAMARAFTRTPELWERYMEKQSELTDALIQEMGRKRYEPPIKVERRKERRT